MRSARELTRLIERLSKKRGYCYASRKWIAVALGWCERKVTYTLAKLAKLGALALEGPSRKRRIRVVQYDAQMTFNFDAAPPEDVREIVRENVRESLRESIPAKPPGSQELHPNSAPDIRDFRDRRDFSNPPAPLSGGSPADEKWPRRRRMTRRERRKEAMRASIYRACAELEAAGQLAKGAAA